MKIIVTGCRGQLGFDCVRELLKRGYTEVIGIDKKELDITDEIAVHNFILAHKPDVIIHSAAWTAVDEAEKFRDSVKKVNVDAVRFIAESAEEVCAKMVYISTDYIFPGDGDCFYEVTDQPAPQSFYGKTKLDGENVAKVCSRLFVVRISWAFGINGKNFVKTMLKLGATNSVLTVVDDQIGSPTYTRDLSKLLCDMIETDKYGTYHATNEGVCSWAEFAKEIFAIANKNVEIIPVSTKKYLENKPEQALRPLNSRLSKKSLDIAGFNRLPTWQDALRRYIKELKII